MIVGEEPSHGFRVYRRWSSLSRTRKAPAAGRSSNGVRRSRSNGRGSPRRAHSPTAETMDPARTVAESLTSRPEIREQHFRQLLGLPSRPSRSIAFHQAFEPVGKLSAFHSWALIGAAGLASTRIRAHTAKSVEMVAFMICPFLSLAC